MVKLRLYCLIANSHGNVFWVEIDDTEDVYALKKAIKNDKKKILKQWDADDLILYKSKKGDGNYLSDEDEIEKEIEKMEIMKVSGELLNDIFTKDEKLDPTYAKKDGSKHQYIHVLVKLPVNQSLKRKSVSDYFPELKKAKQGEIIEVNELVPMINPNELAKKIYVRKCYVSIFNEIMKDLKDGKLTNTMITGNPGIGKSYFYLYFICQLIENPDLLCGRDLIINSDNEYRLFVVNNEGKYFDVVDHHDYKFRRNVVRLVDGMSKDLIGWIGPTILFASPSNKKVAQNPSTMMKNWEGSYYIMPTWKSNELTALNEISDELKETEDSLEEKINMVGPVPRFIFGQRLSDQEEIIDGLINSANTRELLRFVMSKTAVRDGHFSHRLLQMIPKKLTKGTNAAFFLDFLSSKIGDKIVENANDEILAEFKQFALDNSDPYSAAFRGHIYERLIYRRFFTKSFLSLPFPGKVLKTDGTDGANDNFTIPFDLTSMMVADNAFLKLENVILEENSTKYFYPKSKSFKSIDSFLLVSDAEKDTSTLYLLQMTISKTHPIYNKALVDVMQWAEKFKFVNEIQFVFVVPTKVYSDWKTVQNIVLSKKEKEEDLVSIQQNVIELNM